jgi:hypothetical protein
MDIRWGLTPGLIPKDQPSGVHDEGAAAAAADRLGRREHEAVPEELQPGRGADLRVRP